MISRFLGKMIFKVITTLAVLTTSATAFAQNQARDAVADLNKTAEVKSSEKLNDAEITRDQSRDDRTDLTAQNKTADLIDPFSNSKNRFSSEATSKTLSPGKQTNMSTEWQFSFAPYLFAAGLSGTIGARGRTTEIDLSFGDVLKKLDVGLMGTFEARKKRFIFVSDLIWAKMSSEKNTPGGLYSTAKLGVNLFIFDPEVGYRIVNDPKGSIDALAGVRIWSVENNLNLGTGTLPGFDVSQRKSWAAPVVGARGILNLSPKFFLSGKFDVGGAGIGAGLTMQFFGGAGFRVKPNIALIAGYRYLQVDYDDNGGFLFDTNMNGFIFGAKFNF